MPWEKENLDMREILLSALNRVPMKLLIRPNTSIKDYHYEKNTKVNSCIKIS